MAMTSLLGVYQSKLRIIFTALTCIDSKLENLVLPHIPQIKIPYVTDDGVQTYSGLPGKKV